MTSIVVRCDANETTGLGHVSRCLSLMRWVRAAGAGVSVEFVGNFSPFAVELLTGHDVKVVAIPDGGGVLDAIVDADIVVTDSYTIDGQYIGDVTAAPAATVFIDDFNRYDLSAADLVVNFTAHAQELGYPAHNTFLGLDWLIVPPELAEQRERRRPAGGDLGRVLVFFGGAGAPREAATVINEIRSAAPAVTVVYVAAQADVDPAIGYEFAKPSSTYHQLYESIDAVVCAGGLTKYEAAFLGVPTAVLSATTGQAEDTAAFAAAGLCHDLGPMGSDPLVIKRRLDEFLGSTDLRAEIVDRCGRAFRTDSTRRLADRIMDLV